MATKSILKNIVIADKRHGKSLVTALEHAATNRPKEVHLSRTYSDARENDLHAILQLNKGD